MIAVSGQSQVYAMALSFTISTISSSFVSLKYIIIINYIICSARAQRFHRLRTVVERRHKIIIHIIQLLLSVIALFIVEKIYVKILNFRIKIFQLCYFVHFIQFSDDDSLLTKQIRRAMSVCVCCIHIFGWHGMAQPCPARHGWH